MLLVIDGLITVAELDQLRRRFEKAHFGDGRVTAGALAVEAKRNLQLPEDSEDARAMARVVGDALKRNDKFVSAALPRAVYPPLFNRYVPGMGFETHLDNAIRFGAMTLRADISGTLFLSDPDEYQGGTLMIEDTYGAQRVKLSAGSLVLYPSSSLHRVEPVTQGTRDVAVFWVQSLVREDSQRSLLFALDQAIQSLRARAPDSPEIQALANAYHNLLRMWTEM
ncbi:MAG: Fe2+-dependent dioxygenase [Gammaproteobacteria bacterium]